MDQTIDTYTATDLNSGSLVDRKHIVNVYADASAARRGNASQSTVSRYRDIAETQLIDETVTLTSLFDSRGNAIDQEALTYVPDSASVKTLVSRRVLQTDSADYNNRGDALKQEVTTYQIDYVLQH